MKNILERQMPWLVLIIMMLHIGVLILYKIPLLENELNNMGLGRNSDNVWSDEFLWSYLFFNNLRFLIIAIGYFIFKLLKYKTHVVISILHLIALFAFAFLPYLNKNSFYFFDAELELLEILTSVFFWLNVIFKKKINETADSDVTILDDITMNQ